MSSPTRETVELALRSVMYPGFRRDIVTLGMVVDVQIDGGRVRIDLHPGSDKAEIHTALRVGATAAVKQLRGVEAVEVQIAGAAAGRGKDPFAERAAIPGIAHVIAVASGKGGVGKSTVAANLAVALARAGRRVGLLDADVYGPSVPIMFGLNERPYATPDKRIHPPERHGVRLISMGFFLDEQSPVIWRGPIVMGIIRQFLRDVEWGPLDVLVVDLPPGTGDAPLTLVQQVPVSGGVIVSTPQDVALLDVARGMAMFAQVHAPVIGVVENMAGYTCPQCGTTDAIFGEGGAAALAAQYEVPLLARIPITAEVRVAGDGGAPIVAARPDDPASQAFAALAARVWTDVTRMAPVSTEATG